VEFFTPDKRSPPGLEPLRGSASPIQKAYAQAAPKIAAISTTILGDFEILKPVGFCMISGSAFEHVNDESAFWKNGFRHVLTA
jgi:hypothetical protein